MLSDSDNSPIKKKKVKSRILATSSSSDDDSDVPVRKRKSRPRVSSSSDSDGSCVIKRTHKKLRVLSDSDSEISTSDSEIYETLQRTTKNYRSSARALETDSDISEGSTGKRKIEKAESGSQSSDSDESEKCIICFKAFRGIIAHPSGCAHNFHSECLLTWSQTSNTCPIDRIKYTQIVATRTSDGSVLHRQDVSTPPPQDHNDIEPDDPTFCEVCSQHDREHEMLLCDRCEAGYHLNCLTPPLIEVPLGDWFCPDCASLDNAEIDDDEINDLLRDGTVLTNRMRQRPSASTRPRIGPRTRAVQRVINSIRQMAEQSEQYRPSTSTSRSNSRRTQRRKKSSHRRSTRYKVEVITTEDGTTIEVKVAVNAGRRRKKKRKSNASCGHRRMNSSKRSSAKLEAGGDNHRSNANDLSFQRLDIFGSRPQLEYFSGCEAEDELDDEGGLGLLRARPATVGVRGMANRKQMAAQILRSAPRRPLPRIAVSSAPPDLVSSILDEQTKWHSPNAVIQSNSKGEVKVVLPQKSSTLPVKRSAGNGEGASSSTADVRSSSSPKEGGESQRNGESSTSVPPLQPPPQPVFSRVYEDEDFDLYADIEPPLAPPPEPPALLLALEGDDAASSPEDAMLVIDDRQTYDPELPTSPPPSPEKPSDEKEEKELSTKPVEKTLGIPPVDLGSIRLPSPEPEMDDCPNRVMYSAASVNIARQTSDSDSEKDIEICNPTALLSRMSLDPSKKN